MKTYPLPALTLDEAMDLQFRLVDTVTRHFDGYSLLSQGDLGVRRDLGRPETTARVEQVLADFFGAPACRLVQGAGTGAIRAVYFAMVRPGDTVLVHEAPIYPTTATLFDRMGLRLIRADFHDPEALRAVADSDVGKQLRIVHVQHTRQQPEDRYDLAMLVPMLKELFPQARIVVDDNYAVLKTPKIGVEYGADVSTFSLFKLMGPEGVGCILGPQDVISEIDRQNYSGGGQVQGWQALDALRAMIAVPVLWAVQGKVVDEVASRLNAGEIPEVEKCLIANAQDRTLLIRFREPIARLVLEAAPSFGAIPHPVGANSRYEITPLFYRISGTFLERYPELADFMIRVNPLRAGADTVIRILREAIKEAKRCS